MSHTQAAGAEPDRGVPAAPVLLLVALGAASVAALASAAPSAPGARRLAAPETVLSVFDAAAVLLVAIPHRAGLRAALVLAAVAAPFHAALAAAAGAGAGLHVAVATCAGAWCLALSFAAAQAPRFATAATVAASLALPLAAYGLGEFGRLPTGPAFLASPLTAPVVLAHRAPDAASADALPALVGAALVAAGAAWAGRRAGVRP